MVQVGEQTIKYVPVLCKDCKHKIVCKNCEDPYNAVVECVYHTNDNTFDVQWISTLDRIPEIDEDVLVWAPSMAKNGFFSVWSITTVERNGVEVPCWDDSYGYYQELDQVEYWARLPRPPKVGEWM